MAVLVEEEMTRQLQQLSPQLSQYLRPVEIITYAMNRLQPLYACSQTGYQHQLNKARREHRSTIAQAVRYGIAAVQRDPLRQFQPMAAASASAKTKADGETTEQTLVSLLHGLLQQGQICWEDLPEVVQQRITHHAPQLPLHPLHLVPNRKQTGKPINNDGNCGPPPWRVNNGPINGVVGVVQANCVCRDRSLDSKVVASRKHLACKFPPVLLSWGKRDACGRYVEELCLLYPCLRPPCLAYQWRRTIQAIDNNPAPLKVKPL